MKFIFSTILLLAIVGVSFSYPMIDEENYFNDLISKSTKSTTKKQVATTTKETNDDKAIYDDLVKRGNDLLTLANTTLEKFRKENNYFASSLKKEISRLTKYMERLKNEGYNINENNPFLKEFLYQAESEVNRITNRINELIELGKKGTDASYVQLLHMIDALKQRAFADIGFLFMHNKVEKADGIKSEIMEIEKLELQLKSVDFHNSPQKAEEIVETILEHERKLQEELFKIEEDL